MSKKLEDMNFSELVDHVTQQVHLGLLEGGSKEMRSRIHLWLAHAIAWDRREQNKAKKGKEK
jgi:hypothetical protein